MKQVEEYYDTQSLQIQEAKKWIRTRFISEVDISTLPLVWAVAWSQALTELGTDFGAIVSARVEGEK